MKQEIKCEREFFSLRKTAFVQSQYLKKVPYNNGEIDVMECELWEMGKLLQTAKKTSFSVVIKGTMQHCRCLFLELNRLVLFRYFSKCYSDIIDVIPLKWYTI